MYIKMAKYNQQRGLRQIIRLIVRDIKLVPFKALGFKIMENHEQANSTIASVYMRKKLTPLHVPRAYNSACAYSDFLTVTE